MDMKTELTHLMKLRKFNHPDNCLTLDIAQILDENKELAKNTPTVLQFSFELTKSAPSPFSAHIYMEEKANSLERDNPSAKKSSTGDRIERLDMGKERFQSYAIDFKQNIFVEEDKSIGCANYPTADFDTYNDCDQAAMLASVLKPPYPPGFTPVFMTNSPANVTSGPVYIRGSKPDYYKFIGLKLPRSCPRHCVQTRSSVTFLVEGKYEYNLTRIDLLLPETMLVTRTFYPSFSLVELLAGLGGSLGLWLGLGALQLLQGCQELLQNCG